MAWSDFMRERHERRSRADSVLARKEQRRKGEKRTKGKKEKRERRKKGKKGKKRERKKGKWCNSISRNALNWI